MTPIATESRSGRGGYAKGHHLRYIVGHSGSGKGPQYTVEDCGYETPCWVWQRQKTKKGYGNGWANGKRVLAHRAFYEKTHGKIPPKRQIHHRCFNPSCVNPDHLEVVSKSRHREIHRLLR